MCSWRIFYFIFPDIFRIFCHELGTGLDVLAHIQDQPPTYIQGSSEFSQKISECMKENALSEGISQMTFAEVLCRRIHLPCALPI